MALKWTRFLHNVSQRLQLTNWLCKSHSCRSLSTSARLRFCCALHSSFQGNEFNVYDITSSEALRALRPFYLAVHPDLFVQHPHERSTNEDSLKKLNSYLDALDGGCGQGHSTAHTVRPKPVDLTFFVRARNTGSLRAVSLSLNAYSIGSAVHDILQSCDLFTDVSNPTVSKLIRTKHHESQKHKVLSTYQHHKFKQRPIQDYPDFDYAFSERRRTSHEHVRHRPPESLKSWLSLNLPLAKSRLDLSKSLQEGNRLLRESMCLRYGLQSVRIDPNWTAVTVKGHLLNLNKVLQCVDVQALTEKRSLSGSSTGGLNLVLGHRNYVSVDGGVHLSCEDTLQQWLQYLMNQVSLDLSVVKEIDSLEEQLLCMLNKRGGDRGDPMLSLSLRRPSTLITPTEYRTLLAKYNHSCRQESFSHSLADAPRNFSHVVITIVKRTQAGAVAMPFLLKDGSVEVPLDCSVRCLEEFLLHNCHDVDERRLAHDRSKDVMEQTLRTCKEKLQLSELTVRANVSDDQIKDSCRRLLQIASHEPQNSGSDFDTGDANEGIELKGHYMSIANSYSVSSDGELRIPWNFNLN